MGTFERLRTDVWIAREYVPARDAAALFRELAPRHDAIRTRDEEAGANEDEDGDEEARPFVRWSAADENAISARGIRYVNLRGRRCVAFGGAVHERATLAVDDFPPYTREVMDAVSKSASALLETTFIANHALVNAYEEDEGIMPHEDGPLYRDIVSILSLGASRLIQFWPKRVDHVDGASPMTTREPSFEIFLPHRSLIVFTGEAYTKYLHAIESGTRVDIKSHRTLNPNHFPIGHDVAERRGCRLSMTFRQVLNVRRAPAFLTKPRV